MLVVTCVFVCESTYMCVCVCLCVSNQICPDIKKPCLPEEVGS